MALKRWSGIAMALVIALGLASCSTAGVPGTPDSSQSPTGGTSEIPTLFDYVTDTSGFMPYVEGMTIQLATEVIQASGLKASFYDFSPLKQEIADPAEWIVVDQPDFGTELARNSIVRLGAFRKGDPEKGETSEFAFELARDDYVVKNFAGLTLKEARELAKSTETYVFEDDASGEDRTVWNDENWIVIDQDKQAGSSTGTNSISLDVLKIGERGSDIKAQDTHIGEMQYFGTVTGFDVTYTSIFTPPQINYVKVDGDFVALDLIGPYTYSCLDGGDAGLAEADKRELLKIGTKVRVLKTDPEESEWGVLHPLASYNPLRPFDNSANESLVARGYWVPTQSTNFIDVAYSSTAKFKIDDDLYTPLQQKYLRKLIIAANTSRKGRVADLQTCITLALAYEEKVRLEMEEMRRQEAIWAQEAERDRQRWLEAHSCADGSRDGDGDGICHEG